MKTALVIGGTGLVGSHLIKLLLQDDRYGLVKSFVRRPSGTTHQKFTEVLVNFDKPEEWFKELVGDDLFSCLGTTIKTAGSKEKQYKVDYTYQYQTAKYASENGVKSFVLVSSAGANPDSTTFYTKMKGELDRDVKLLSFKNIAIIKPSILVGDRNENRFGEKLAIPIIRFFSNIIPPVKKYRPIHAEIVAKAMINAATINETDKVEYELEEVFELSELN